MDDALRDEERYLIEQIHRLRESYELAAKPYVDRLVHLRSIQPLPTWAQQVLMSQSVNDLPAPPTQPQGKGG